VPRAFLFSVQPMHVLCHNVSFPFVANTYTAWAKKVTPFLAFEFPLLLDALYLQFLFTHVSFSLNDVVPLFILHE